MSLARAVAGAVGLLLLVAAGLKAFGTPDAGNPLAGWVAADWLHLAAIQYEVALGVWLLGGRSRAAGWLVAVGTFVVFAGLTLWSGLVGRASCGCFGDVPVNPWWAFGLDIGVVVALLTLGRPRGAAWRAEAGTAGLFVAGVGLVLAAWTAVAVVGFGSTSLALAATRNDPLAAGAGLLDYGPASAGEVISRAAVIHNRTNRPVKIVGGTADCSCTTLDDLPVEIPAGEARPVGIRVRFPATPGQVQRTCKFWSDLPGYDTVEVILAGRCVGP